MDPAMEVATQGVSVPKPFQPNNLMFLFFLLLLCCSVLLHRITRKEAPCPMARATPVLLPERHQLGIMRLLPQIRLILQTDKNLSPAEAVSALQMICLKITDQFAAEFNREAPCWAVQRMLDEMWDVYVCCNVDFKTPNWRFARESGIVDLEAVLKRLSPKLTGIFADSDGCRKIEAVYAMQIVCLEITEQFSSFAPNVGAQKVLDEMWRIYLWKLPPNTMPLLGSVARMLRNGGFVF